MEREREREREAEAEAQAQARELLGFLRLAGRPDVRAQAAAHVLGLTGSAAGRALLAARPPLLEALVLLSGERCAAAARDAYLALVNLAAEPASHGALRPALPLLLRRVLEPGYGLAEPACSLLANLSREEASCRRLLRALRAGGAGLAPLVEAFCADGSGALHGLGPVLANLTQLPEARELLLDRAGCLVQRLVPYTQYGGSAVRRRGVIGALRNCCFEHKHHEWLLSEEVDLLPFLLLPLAGPEEFPEEEVERLPLDLQYLPQDKQRETDPDIRKMLLEAILLLTATKAGRQLVKEKGTYLVLRELHRWETEPDVLTACEKLIQVLIGDEPEAGMENLLEVKIPEDVEKQLQHLDEEEEEERRRKEERSQGHGVQQGSQGLLR